MPTLKPTLWGLARSGLPIEAAELATAIEDQASEDDPDFRTRLLIRDGLQALAAHWGPDRLNRWVAGSPESSRLKEFRLADLGPAGFPSLAAAYGRYQTRNHIAVSAQSRLQIERPSRLEIVGSTSLILCNVLSRQTDDIDVVNGLPSTWLIDTLFLTISSADTDCTWLISSRISCQPAGRSAFDRSDASKNLTSSLSIPAMCC